MSGPHRFEIHLVRLDPTRGSEIRKTRPCLIVSPDDMNRGLKTVIVAPMTSTRRDYPTRVDLTFAETDGQIVLDRIRTVDKARLAKRLGVLPDDKARAVSGLLQEMFAHGD